MSSSVNEKRETKSPPSYKTYERKKVSFFFVIICLNVDFFCFLLQLLFVYSVPKHVEYIHYNLMHNTMFYLP